MISVEASHLQLGILDRSDDVLFFTHYTSMKDVIGYTSSQAYQLGVYLDLIRHFVGKEWVPNEIGIEYPVVPPVVEEHFPGSRILTSQRVGYIAVPRACLHMAARNGDPDVQGNGNLILTTDFNFVETLGALLQPYLPEGYPSARLAASLMDTSVRTLARRLTAAGVTYQSVVDDLRFNKARELLRNTSAPVSDIASTVGFDDPAHFTRMFRRIASRTPRQFRRAIRD